MDTDDLNWAAFFGGRFLTAAGVPSEGPGLEVLIESAGVEEIEDPKTKAMRRKLVVYLAGLRPFVPSRTAAGCLGHLLGERLSQWRGRKVNIFCDSSVRVGGKITGGIRVWGSPDLAQEVEISVDLGARKPPARCRLRPTGGPLASLCASWGLPEADVREAIAAATRRDVSRADPARLAAWARKNEAAIRAACTTTTADTATTPADTATTTTEP